MSHTIRLITLLVFLPAFLSAHAAALRPAPPCRAPQTGMGLYTDFYPTTGSPRVLVVLAQFQDVSFADFYNPQEFFREMVNGDSFEQYGGTGSILKYFTDQSSGKFTPIFDVAGPVTLPHDQAYYGSNYGQGWDVKANLMVSDAAKLLDAEVDFSLYDEDGDGEVDFIYFFYAGKGEADSGIETTIWPHAGKIKQDANFVYLDNKWINTYACSNELQADGSPAGIGSFVHEYAHILGLPDIYPTTLGDNWDYTSGQYCVMDYGPYNNSGHTPPNFGAFERNALGWNEPLMLDGPMTVTLRDISTGDFGLLPTVYSNEFYLVENRQLCGWDAFIPNHGLIFTHIDYQPDAFKNNEVNNDRNHPLVDLIEANCQPGFAANQTHYTFPGTTGKTEFTAATSPAMITWDGLAVDLPVTDITEHPDGTITFNVAGGGEMVSAGTPRSSMIQEEPVYFTLQGTPLKTPQPGTIVIERRGCNSRKIRF